MPWKKILDEGLGVSRFSVGYCFVSQCRKKSYENPSVFQRISSIEKLYAEEGVIAIFLKLFCLTVPKNFVEEPLCVSENFCLAKIMDKKEWYQDFPSKSFSVTVPTKFVRNPFVLQNLSGIEQKWIRERGCFYGSPSKKIFLFYRNTSQRTIFYLTTFQVSINLLHNGVNHDFLSKSFCLTVPKFSVGEPFCSSENFW